MYTLVYLSTLFKEVSISRDCDCHIGPELAMVERIRDLNLNGAHILHSHFQLLRYHCRIREGKCRKVIVDNR